jgi:hypothetical protein
MNHSLLRLLVEVDRNSHVMDGEEVAVGCKGLVQCVGGPIGGADIPMLGFQ